MAVKYTGVISAGKGWTKVRGADGKVYTVKGSRAWRNNNPGNIEYGAFARSMGAIGSDGRFAIFPTYEAGRDAKSALIFDTGAYKNLSLKDAIRRYAPAGENNPTAYANAVARQTGIDLGTTMSEIPVNMRGAVLDAMQGVEGFRPGTINGEQAPPPQTAPAPASKPASVAMAQNAPQTAIASISGLLGGGAMQPFRDLGIRPHWLHRPDCQRSEQGCREPSGYFRSRPAPADQRPQTIGPDYAGIGRLIKQNYNGSGDLIRNRFDPGFTYSQPAPEPAPPSPPPRQEATVTTPPTLYQVDLDKALNYARDTGKLKGISGLFPNSMLYGATQDEITKALPEGATFDPQTNRVSVQNRGILVNPPIDPTTGQIADLSAMLPRKLPRL